MRPELLRRTLSFALAAAVLVSVPAVSTQAAGRRRAVTPPSATGKLTAEISGTILDDVTGHPVVAAHVTAGTRSANTDAAGKYTIKNITSFHGLINVEVSRSGYATRTQKLTTGGKQTLDLRLTPGAVAHVRRVDNSTYDIDFDSVEFGYAVAFSGYRSAEFEDFCNAAGNPVAVDRSEMRRITGPAVMVDNATCCPGAQTLRVSVELKTGGTSDMFFVDACNGFSNIDLIGRDHTSGQFVDTPFAQIAEVVFP
jgi:hypothetical protein